MAYPRTADLHRGVSGVVRSNVPYGKARVKYTLREYAGANPGTTGTNASATQTYEAESSSSTSSVDSVLRVFGAPFSAEGSLAYGFSDAVALGGWLSLELLGAELRLQPLSQRDGAPLSATVALGAAHVGLLPSFERRLLQQGFGARVGVDLGLTGGRWEALLGAYGSLIRRRRNVQAVPDEDIHGDEFPGFGPSVMVIRDELKLSIPFGLALHGGQGAVVFGLVPEWTLDASLREARCRACDSYPLTAFEQVFAIYFTVGVEGWQANEAASSPQKVAP